MTTTSLQTTPELGGRHLASRPRLLPGLAVYFLVVFGYLLANAAVPLTTGGWRGPADLIAVGAYLAGVVPLAGIAALEVGLLGRDRDARGRLKLHATFVGLFLVVAHVAMIAGMLDPAVLGWHSPAMVGMADMAGMAGMAGMAH